MKKILAALLFVVSAFCQAEIVTIPIPGAPGLSVTVGTGVNALPLQNINNNPNAVNITTSDDWYTQVPLGFTFPFFGQNFTTSWAATNGFVTFQNPQQSGLWGGCCSGVNLANTTDDVVTIDITITDGSAVTGYYIKGLMIDPYTSAKVVTNGEKIILAESTIMTIVSDTDNSIDMVASYAEIV